MNRAYQDSGGELGQVIRRATFEDMDDLTMICHLCYPDLLRWRGPKFHTRRWWRSLIEADYCELYVCQSNGQAIGFVAFVLDRAQYEEILSRHRPGLLPAFYMFATCPRLFVRKALQKLKESSTKNLLKLLRLSSDDDETRESEGLRSLFYEPIPWLGPAAVVPNMQGKGVGTEMLKFCFQRAIELGYKEIRAFVVRGNGKSIKLLKKLGFVVTHEGQHNIFYKKALT